MTVVKSNWTYYKQEVGSCCGAEVLHCFPHDEKTRWPNGMPTEKVYGQDLGAYLESYKKSCASHEADILKLKEKLPSMVTNKITIAITRTDQSDAAKVLEEFGFKPVEEWFYTNGTGLRVYIYLKDSANKPKEWAKKE